MRPPVSTSSVLAMWAGRPRGKAGEARSLKTKRLRKFSGFRSQFVGVGVRHALFPGGTRLDALAFAGGVLPDATLRGMRMFRSHGGTVLTVAGRDLLSEASMPSSDAPCRERRAGRGADTPAKRHLASAPLPRGRHRLLTDRWPRVTGLTSCLSGCFRSCSGVTWFFTPPQSRRLTDFARSARSPRSRRPCASRSA
jgi:hypothetical protein